MINDPPGGREAGYLYTNSPRSRAKGTNFQHFWPAQHRLGVLLGPQKAPGIETHSGAGSWRPGFRLQRQGRRGVRRGLTASAVPPTKPLYSGYWLQLRNKETKAGGAATRRGRHLKPSRFACFPFFLPPSSPGWMGCRKQQTGPFRNCSFQSGRQDLIQNLAHPRNTRGDALCSSRGAGLLRIIKWIFPPSGVCFLQGRTRDGAVTKQAAQGSINPANTTACTL